MARMVLPYLGVAGVELGKHGHAPPGFVLGVPVALIVSAQGETVDVVPVEIGALRANLEDMVELV